MRPTRWSVLGVALAVLVPSVSAGASTTKITGNAAAISYSRASATAMTKVTHLVSVSSGVTYLGVTTIGGKVAFSLDYQTGHPGSSSEVPVNVSQYISASGNVIHWDLTVLASPCHGGALTCHSRVDRLVMLDLRGAHYWTLESNAETPPVLLRLAARLLVPLEWGNGRSRLGLLVSGTATRHNRLQRGSGHHSDVSPPQAIRDSRDCDGARGREGRERYRTNLGGPIDEALVPSVPVGHRHGGRSPPPL